MGHPYGKLPILYVKFGEVIALGKVILVWCGVLAAPAGTLTERELHDPCLFADSLILLN